jgi:hypothetical protein
MNRAAMLDRKFAPPAAPETARPWHLQYGAIEPAGVGGNRCHRGSSVRSCGGREMDQAQTVIPGARGRWV